VGTALVNLAPDNPFLPSDAALLQQGNLLNFHGLTQLTASLWPFITFAYLGLLGAALIPVGIFLLANAIKQKIAPQNRLTS
jgi:hypothetical protein